MFVDVNSVTKNADGSYTISGDLKDGVPAQEGRVDTWDFVGHKYKAAYDNFLNAAGLRTASPDMYAPRSRPSGPSARQRCPPVPSAKWAATTTR